jgi:hypothetical protein
MCGWTKASVVRHRMSNIAFGAAMFRGFERRGVLSLLSPWRAPQQPHVQKFSRPSRSDRPQCVFVSRSRRIGARPVQACTGNHAALGGGAGEGRWVIATEALSLPWIEGRRPPGKFCPGKWLRRAGLSGLATRDPVPYGAWPAPGSHRATPPGPAPAPQWAFAMGCR